MIYPKFDQHMRLYAYWDEKRGDRPMPARADIDPADIGPLLSYITLMDIVDGRYRYRVMGSRAVEDLGHDYTGTFVGAHSGRAYATALIELVERVCTSRQPLFVSGRYKVKERVGRLTSRLFLPLSADGETVNMVLITRIAETARVNVPLDWERAIMAAIDRADPVADIDDLRHRCVAWESHMAAEAA